MFCNIHHEHNQPRCVYGVYANKISITNCHRKDGNSICVKILFKSFYVFQYATLQDSKREVQYTSF